MLNQWKKKAEEMDVKPVSRGAKKLFGTEKAGRHCRLCLELFGFHSSAESVLIWKGMDEMKKHALIHSGQGVSNAFQVCFPEEVTVCDENKMKVSADETHCEDKMWPTTIAYLLSSSASCQYFQEVLLLKKRSVGLDCRLPYCGFRQTSFNFPALESHLIKHMETKLPLYRCGLCGRDFQYIRHHFLKIHKTCSPLFEDFRPRFDEQLLQLLHDCFVRTKTAMKSIRPKRKGRPKKQMLVSLKSGEQGDANFWPGDKTKAAIKPIHPRKRGRPKKQQPVAVSFQEPADNDGNLQLPSALDPFQAKVKDLQSKWPTSTMECQFPGCMETSAVPKESLQEHVLIHLSSGRRECLGCGASVPKSAVCPVCPNATGAKDFSLDVSSLLSLSQDFFGEELENQLMTALDLCFPFALKSSQSSVPRI